MACSTKPCRHRGEAVNEFKCRDANEKLHHSSIEDPLFASPSHAEKRVRWETQTKCCYVLPLPLCFAPRQRDLKLARGRRESKSLEFRDFIEMHLCADKRQPWVTSTVIEYAGAKRIVCLSFFQIKLKTRGLERNISYTHR